MAPGGPRAMAQGMPLLGTANAADRAGAEDVACIDPRPCTPRPHRRSDRRARQRARRRWPRTTPSDIRAPIRALWSSASANRGSSAWLAGERVARPCRPAPATTAAGPAARRGPRCPRCRTRPRAAASGCRPASGTGCRPAASGRARLVRGEHQYPERSARNQDPAQLPDDTGLVLDGAQHPDAPARVGRTGRERHPLPAPDDGVHPEQPRRRPAGPGHRVDDDRHDPGLLPRVGGRAADTPTGRRRAACPAGDRRRAGPDRPGSRSRGTPPGSRTPGRAARRHPGSSGRPCRTRSPSVCSRAWKELPAPARSTRR